MDTPGDVDLMDNSVGNTSVLLLLGIALTRIEELVEEAAEVLIGITEIKL